MTNVDVLVNPLSADDRQHNQEILNLWQAQEAERQESRRERNDAYRQRVESERITLADMLWRGERRPLRAFPRSANEN